MTCPLCSTIQAAIDEERLALERLLDGGERVSFRQLPPAEGDGIVEEEWLEFACRRDEYESARSRRVRADNRFFDSCPRCQFDMKRARRDLELLRAELPGQPKTADPVEAATARARATGA